MRMKIRTKRNKFVGPPLLFARQSRQVSRQFHHESAVMLLNADLSKRSVVHAATLDWVASPAKGVERRMLFRMGDEKARATSIVRYAPDSHFPRHGHPRRRGVLVLEGVFQDETGDFPVGTDVN